MLFSSLNRCSYIGLRDKRSFAILKGSLDDFSCVAIENDLSLNVSASPTSRARFLIYNAFKNLPRVSLNKRLNSFFVVCPHFSASRFDRFELDIAIRRQKNKGLTPLFIPCCCCFRFQNFCVGGVSCKCTSGKSKNVSQCHEEGEIGICYAGSSVILAWIK